MGYKQSTHKLGVKIYETYGSGATTKLEVDNDGTFVTVWERDVNTGANETGGVISAIVGAPVALLAPQLPDEY
jgi:hypothetical protein